MNSLEIPTLYEGTCSVCGKWNAVSEPPPEQLSINVNCSQCGAIVTLHPSVVPPNADTDQRLAENDTLHPYNKKA